MKCNKGESLLLFRDIKILSKTLMFSQFMMNIEVSENVFDTFVRLLIRVLISFQQSDRIILQLKYASGYLQPA